MPEGPSFSLQRFLKLKTLFPPISIAYLIYISINNIHRVGKPFTTHVINIKYGSLA